jgi:hypothetical protein
MKEIEKAKRIPSVIINVLSFYILLSIGCSQSNNSKDDIVTIDIKKVIQNERDVPLSQFVESLEYLPLEITSESSISGGPGLYFTEEYIIVRNYSPVSNSLLLLFDRRTGKFIRNLGKLGRGPGEYLRPLDRFYNPYDKKIYANAENSINTYNLEGVFLDSFEKLKVKESSVKDGYIRASLEAYLNIDTCIYYLNNSTGSIVKRLIIATKNNEIRSFPQYEKWSSSDVFINQNPIFFSWENKLSFKEKSNDTIFYVSMDHLVPRYVLYTGDLRYPYRLSRDEAMEQLTQPKDYFETFNIFENSQYLFFDIASKNKPVANKPGSFKMIRNLCIFDKTTKKISICMNNSETDNSCLIDDINNFIPIMPVTITGNNELIAVIEAVDIIKWKAENPENLAGLKEKLPWLDKISALDNPVIVIGKLKH